MRDGEGIALVGPAGIGKSVMADDLAVALAGTHHVVRVQGRRSALDIPMGAFEAVLPPGIDQVRVALTRVRDQLQASGRPGLLVVDDADSLDETSAFMTHALAAGTGITVLISHRGDAALPPAVGQLWSDGLVHEVMLGSLTDDEVNAIAAAWLGGPLGPSTLQRVCRLVDGNPLFVGEVLAGGLRSGELVAQGATWHWTGPWRSGLRLVGLVEEHLRSLTRRQRDLLEVVAIAEPIAPGELFAVTDQFGPDDGESLEQLGLLRLDPTGDMGLSHPLYGEVLRTQLPAMKRQRFAAILARLPEPGRVDRRIRAVRWRLDAGLEVPAAELVEAAESSMRAEDLRSAIDLARRAIDAGAPVRGGHLLGIALDEVGLATEAVAALEQAWQTVADPGGSSASAADLDDAEQEAISLLGLARAELAITHVDDPTLAFDHLDQLVARVPAARQRADAARVLLLQLSGRPLDALDLAARVSVPGDLDLARLGLPMVLSLAMTGRGAEAVALAERALAARDTVGPQTGLARDAVFGVAMAVALETCGRLDDARALATYGHARSIEERSALGEAWFCLVLGNVCLVRAEAGAAEAWHGEAAAAFASHSRPAARWASAGAAIAAALDGSVERATAHLDAIDAAGATGWRFLDPLIDRARAWRAWSAGDLDQAREHLQIGLDRARPGAMHWLESVLAADQVRFGDLAGAAPLLAELALVVDDPRSRLWARGAGALVDGDLATAAEAAAELVTLGAVVDGGDLLALAAQQAWPDDRSRATELAAGARAATGGHPVVTPALDAMAALPGLSPRMLEIARLAAAGHSSRQVAEQMVIAVRTVDNHLGRVFRVLGLESRQQLAGSLAAWFGPA